MPTAGTDVESGKEYLAVCLQPADGVSVASGCGTDYNERIVYLRSGHDEDET